MNPFTAYRLHITPLSPVHIGTGESYEPTHYVIEEGALHEFDTGAAMAAMLEADREELLRIASAKPNLQMLKDVQSFFYKRRKPLQAHSINCIPVLPGIANLYNQRVGKAANTEGDGKQVINRLEIDRTAYNPITRQPVLFGSSLKGAIRTALLDWKNQGEPLQTLEDYRTGRINKENNQALQQRLLDFRAGKFELDPLRLLQIADAPYQGEAGLPAALVQLAVNRKKHPVRDENGNLRLSQAEQAKGGGLYQILECLPGWRFRAFASQINLQNLGNLSETDRSGNRRLPAESLRFDIDQIARACNRFYLPLLTDERKILKEQGFIDDAWNESVTQALKLNQDKLQQNRAFLLRVGRHSGAESVTLNGVRNIKIMQGNPPYQAEAKTLWLAANAIDQRQNLQPFGWLLVEVEPLDKPTLDWPELRQLCEPHLKAAREFAKKREGQRPVWEKARTEIEAQRREETKRARQAAEAKQAELQAHAARQAELAAMSDQARLVEAFRERMEREGVTQWANSGNGGAWFSELKKLAESASHWNADDKARLVELLQLMGQQEPRLAPKKNDGIKKLIKSLPA